MKLKEILEVSKPTSKLIPDDIHNLADRLGIKWDNDKRFMEFTKKITGTEHLDDLNRDQLNLMYTALDSGKFEDN